MKIEECVVSMDLREFVNTLRDGELVLPDYITGEGRRFQFLKLDLEKMSWYYRSKGTTTPLAGDFMGTIDLEVILLEDGDVSIKFYGYRPMEDGSIGKYLVAQFYADRLPDTWLSDVKLGMELLSSEPVEVI